MARASRAFHDGTPPPSGLPAIYADMLAEMERSADVRLRVVIDILTGASAGGINAIFLAQALESGQSLEPLTELWLDNADVEKLLAPDARPTARFTKFWAAPLIWAAIRRKDDAIDQSVSEETRDEVQQKLSHFIRSRWFQPPFGGKIFTNMLLDALDSMAKAPAGPPLLPPDYPLDLMVTVTDFSGHPQSLRLHSPPNVLEMEHRMVLHFRSAKRRNSGDGQPPPQDGLQSSRWADPAELIFAARATASFPGAFPPFSVRELDEVLSEQSRLWPGRDAFLHRVMPRHAALNKAEDAVLIDGSVLNNAPFAPAIAALKNRPARRAIDRRFVYIDPKPMIGKRWGRPDMPPDEADTDAPKTTPGFFRTIFGAVSDIPREQPIRDNLEAIETRSRTIRHMRRIIIAMRDEIEREIESSFGTTLFLDHPTPSRLAAWRAAAQKRAATKAGFAYPAYAMVKLSSIIEEISDLLCRLDMTGGPALRDQCRQSLWAYARQNGLDQIRKENRQSAPSNIVSFFRNHDLGFRIRRLRFMARRMTEVMGNVDAQILDGRSSDAPAKLHQAIYKSLTLYQLCESIDYYSKEFLKNSASLPPDPDLMLQQLGQARDLQAKDLAAEQMLSAALSSLAKAERRQMLLAYLGFPFYDIATLPLLQGEGLDEYDPIKVDRISPEDCIALRSGGAAAMLKGIEFHSFGAFFSRAYRENDYLWGRLHGAERMIDIVLSTLSGDREKQQKIAKIYKKQAFEAIFEEEYERLPLVRDLIADLRQELQSMGDEDGLSHS